jgi:hypothetical protein
MEPFLIVGTHRTGSSALAEQVGLHPRISCGWESTDHLYGRRRITVAEQVLGGCFDGLTAKERTFMRQKPVMQLDAIGFRLLFRSSARWFGHPGFGIAPVLEGLSSHLRWLARRPDIRIVQLVRQDNLAWLKSLVLASMTGRYAGAPYPEGLHARIGTAEALRRVKTKHYLGESLARLRADRRYLAVTYEDFKLDNRAVANQVIEFLGCDPNQRADVAPLLKVQSRPSNRLDNADVVERALEEAGVRYERTR